MTRLLTFLLLVLAAPLAAQDDDGRFLFGDDAFVAGQSAILRETGRDDAFLAGETVRLAAPVSGTAHMVGRWVEVTADVGDALYAAGQRVEVTAPVTADAALAGQKVSLSAPVGGDLRAFGSEVRLDAPVAGSAIVAAEFVTLDAAIGGDMAVTARDLTFGSAARVGGTLYLYEDMPGETPVPETVAPADRIERRAAERWDDGIDGYAPVRPRRMLQGFLGGVLVITLIAAGFAVIAPQTLAGLRAQVLAAPGRALLTGFVAVSALVGAGVVLALTLIGLLVTPAAWLVAGLTGLAGYVVGAYALGVWIIGRFGGALPDDTRDRALAAGVGALAAGLAGLVPFLGWLFVLALSLTGAGAVTIRLFQPRLFAGADS